MRNIPFFNYPKLYLDNKSELDNIFQDVSSRGAFIMQKDLIEFEERLADYTGAKHALGVANATDGLQIGLMSKPMKEKGEIIISSHTMMATASSIHYAGYKPVPVDAGNDLMIDYDSIINNINDNTVAIMPTQLNGRTCDMDRILEIACKYNLEIFEDAAQALGSKFKDKCAGTFGVASAISFYPAKVLGCLGDGGGVLTNDTDVYEQMLLLRDHGRDMGTGEVLSWGFNTRLDNLQAAFLNYFMKSYDSVVTRRRDIAEKYNHGLKDIEELVLPEAPGNGNHFDIFQNYEIQAQNRDDLKSYLADNGVGSLVQWNGVAIHQLKRLGFNQNLTKTDKLFKEILMIPMNMFIDDQDVSYVIDKIKDFYTKS